MITVYFDGDQTLWDFEALMRRTLGATIGELARLRPGLDGDLSVQAFVDDRDRVAREGRGTTASLEEIRLAAFAASLDRLGVGDAALARHLNAFYFERRHATIDLYDDVLPVLAALTGTHRIGLLSNGNTTRFARSGLEDVFEATVFSSAVGVAKPDREIYRAAETALPADRYVMVGDSLADDVVGAQAAGWRAVWLNRGDEPLPPSVTPDLMATSLRDLPSWLARL